MMNTYYKIKRAIACKLITKKVPLKLSEGIVSFSFDDVPQTAITNGARILKKYGFNGTYYIALGMSNVNDPSKPYFDHSLLPQLASEGSELACHTYNHIQLYKTGRSAIIKDLQTNQEKMQSLIPGYHFENFSYPFGQQSFISKLIMLNRYKSARSVKGGINSQTADLNSLKAVELRMNFDINTIFALIDQAIREKAWLILYTHDVIENPTICGCTPNYFESAVKYCAEKKVKVQTIKEVVDQLTH